MKKIRIHVLLMVLICGIMVFFGCTKDEGEGEKNDNNKNIMGSSSKEEEKETEEGEGLPEVDAYAIGENIPYFKRDYTYYEEEIEIEVEVDYLSHATENVEISYKFDNVNNIAYEKKEDSETWIDINGGYGAGFRYVCNGGKYSCLAGIIEHGAVSSSFRVKGYWTAKEAEDYYIFTTDKEDKIEAIVEEKNIHKYYNRIGEIEKQYITCHVDKETYQIISYTMYVKGEDGMMKLSAVYKNVNADIKLTIPQEFTDRIER